MTIQKPLTEKEMFKNNLYNFNSIDSLNDYLNNKVIKVYPDLKGYSSIIMLVAKNDIKKGKDLISILKYASWQIAKVIN